MSTNDSVELNGNDTASNVKVPQDSSFVDEL